MQSRYEILSALADAPLPSTRKATTLWQQEAEWMLSTEALCGWIESVAELELAQINTGVLRSADWRQVAFKGGSEIGVLNMTTSVRDERDRDFCVSVTWNADQLFDPDPLNALYAAVFHALKKRP